MPVTFDSFHFDPQTLELWEGGVRTGLTLQSARVLKLLLERPGSLVTRSEIREAIWRDRVIEFEQGINACICEIRRVLRDDAAAPRCIETLPRRGYRFIAPVRASSRVRKAWLAAAAIATIAVTLAGVFAIEKRAPSEAIPPVPVEALEAFQTAMHLARQGGAGPDQIIEHLNRAVAIAPAYADAWAALAQAWTHSAAPYDKAADRAGEAVRRALEIDPQHAAATAALAEIRFMLDWDWPAAESLYRSALRLDPDRHETRLGYAGLLFALGRRDEAFRQLEQARRIDPLSTTLYADLSWYLLADGRPAEALEQCRRLSEIEPEGGWSVTCPYRIYLEQGDLTAASSTAGKIMEQFDADAQWTERFEREEPIRVYNEWRLDWHEKNLLAGAPVSHLRMAQILADLDRPGDALEHLAAAVTARERMLPFLPLFPEFRDLQTGETFRGLVAEIGLPERDVAMRRAERPASGKLN